MNDRGPRASSVSFAPVTGLTPVRRPLAASFEETPESSANLLWTTARCKRLLRPILSRLALLRKEKSSSNSSAQGPESSRQYGRIAREKNERFNGERGWQAPSSNLDKRDPEWEPDEGRKKRLRKTYSSKSSVPSTKENHRARSSYVQDTSVQLPSPLVGARSSARLGDGPITDHSTRLSTVRPTSERPKNSTRNRMGYPWTAKANPRDKFRRLAKSTSPSQWMVYDGLYNSLNTLLTNTGKAHSAPSKGASSLFSMCLKKLPAHIVKEQAREEEEYPDDPEDVLTFIYNELENFSKHNISMRQVVRAHGVLLLCNAIEEGTIPLIIARSLVMLCLQNAACTEAEIVVASMTKIMGIIERPGKPHDELFSSVTSPALQALKDISLRTGLYTFLFKQLSILLAEGSISILWISSQDMVEVWNRVLRAITQNQDESTDAIKLVRTVMLRLYLYYKADVLKLSHVKQTINAVSSTALEKPESRFPPHDLEEQDENALIGTITNILTIILAVIYTSSLPPSSRHSCNLDASTSLGLLRTLVVDSQASLNFAALESLQDVVVPKIASFIYMPTISLLICSQAHPSQRESARPLVSSPRQPPSSSSNHALDILSTLLCSMAQCCSCMTASSPFTVMKHLTEALPSVSSESSARSFFCQLATSAAFEFAETTMRQEHLDWALRVEESCTGDRDKPGQTPGRTQSFSKRSKKKSVVSFRWEDSICEWVACTPSPIKPKARAVKVAPSLRNSQGFQTHEDCYSQRGSFPTVESPISGSVEAEQSGPRASAASHTLLSEISPLVTIPQLPSSFTTEQDEPSDEDSELGIPTQINLRSKFRFARRRNKRHVIYDSSTSPSESDELGEASRSPASDPNSIASHPPPGKSVVEVLIPASLSRKSNESGIVPNSRSSQPPAVPSVALEVRVPSLHRLSKSTDSDRQELSDITNQLPGPHKRTWNNCSSRGPGGPPKERNTLMNPRSERHELRTRRQPMKTVRARAGAEKWSLRGRGSDSISDSRVRSSPAYGGEEEESEDELGL